jgi:hypothetical protein
VPGIYRRVYQPCFNAPPIDEQPVASASAAPKTTASKVARPTSLIKKPEQRSLSILALLQGRTPLLSVDSIAFNNSSGNYLLSSDVIPSNIWLRALAATSWYKMRGRHAGVSVSGLLGLWACRRSIPLKLEPIFGHLPYFSASVLFGTLSNPFLTIFVSCGNK